MFPQRGIEDENISVALTGIFVAQLKMRMYKESEWGLIPIYSYAYLYYANSTIFFLFHTDN